MNKNIRTITGAVIVAAVTGLSAAACTNSGPSAQQIGLPVPVTAQLSNPEQIVGVSSQYGGGSTDLPQMDPDGIYAPPSSSGTYVICVGSSGGKYLQYWEGDVMTVTSAATWDRATHTLKVTGAPTAVIHTGKGK